MSVSCIVKIILDPAPATKIRVVETPTQVKLVPGPIKVVNVLEGPKGDIGPQGPAGAPGTSRTTKAGVIPGGSFAGSPKKYSVVFATPFPDATYVLAITSTDSRSWTYESKSAAGFTLNANAAAALVGEVSWSAIVAGET